MNEGGDQIIVYSHEAKFDTLVGESRLLWTKVLTVGATMSSEMGRGHRQTML